jgi:hypothetical protein
MGNLSLLVHYSWNFQFCNGGFGWCIRLLNYTSFWSFTTTCECFLFCRCALFCLTRTVIAHFLLSFISNPPFDWTGRCSNNVLFQRSTRLLLWNSMCSCPYCSCFAALMLQLKERPKSILCIASASDFLLRSYTGSYHYYACYIHSPQQPLKPPQNNTRYVASMRTRLLLTYISRIESVIENRLGFLWVRGPRVAKR